MRSEGRELYAGAEQSRDTGWYQDMLVAYATANGAFNKVSVNQHSDLTPEMVWLDLVSPTEQDRQWVRQTYGQELQFVEELGEIEASERFYRDENGLHLHLYFLVSGTDITRNVNVGFTISNGRLYTLRDDDLPEFRNFYSLALKNPELRNSAVAIILGIISTRIGMLADLYERLQMELEPISVAIFRGDPHTMSRVLESLARIEDINGKARLGLLENRHAQSSLAHSTEVTGQAEAITEIELDVDSLMTFSIFLGERTKFLMDAGTRHDQHRPEQAPQYLHRAVSDPDAADADREHLRHELPPHARGRVVLRLPAGAGPDADRCDRSNPLSQAQGLAVNAGRHQEHGHGTCTRRIAILP